MLPPMKVPAARTVSLRGRAVGRAELPPRLPLGLVPFKSLLAIACGKRPAPARGAEPKPAGSSAAAAQVAAPRDPAANGARIGDEPEDKKKPRADAIDPLDPSFRSAAHLAPPMSTPLAPSAATADAEVGARARVSMEELLPLVVRRIAWGGDRTKAAVHVELATGAFAGTTVTVHAEGKRVRVEVGGAGDLDAIRQRLESRLRGAGIDVESVT